MLISKQRESQYFLTKILKFTVSNFTGIGLFLNVFLLIDYSDKYYIKSGCLIILRTQKINFFRKK